MDFLSKKALDDFYDFRDHGIKIQDAAQATDIPCALAQSLSAEHTQRKTITYWQIRVMVKYLAAGCCIAVARSVAQIRHHPATFIAAEYNRNNDGEIND